MFAFLSKKVNYINYPLNKCYNNHLKISIPNDYNLKTISWNNRDGYIVCGGDSGFLKVLLLAEQQPQQKSGDPSHLEQSAKNSPYNQPKISLDRGVAATANLVTNQSLETHKADVISAVWNEQHRKLTTADINGTIVVWVLHNGVWYEEMVSNRNRSPVCCVSWGSDGKKICILYEDGSY